MASGVNPKYISQESWVNITSQVTSPSGTVVYVAYLDIGNALLLSVQVNNINFTGDNVWIQMPDSFPGNSTVFTSLATAYLDGMVCVFRTNNGSGKYLLVQCKNTGNYNLTATGFCFK